MPSQPINQGITRDEDIEAKIKGAIDSNATDNPHPAIDPSTGKMAVVGDATALEVPNYKYEIEFEYTPDMLTADDKANCVERDGKFYLTLTYEGKRVKPIYRTKVVMLLTRILADALIIDAKGYSSDFVDKKVITKVLDDHLDDTLDLAVMVLGVERVQLEYMTITSLAGFFADLIRNEPNIIEECVRFLSQLPKNSAKAEAEKK